MRAFARKNAHKWTLGEILGFARFFFKPPEKRLNELLGWDR